MSEEQIIARIRDPKRMMTTGDELLLCTALEKLRADLADARQKLAEAQADCAAMRDIVKECYVNEDVVMPSLLPVIQKHNARLDAALAPNAGAALLAEVERLRKQIAKPRACDTDEINALRSQRDQAVALCGELGEVLTAEIPLEVKDTAIIPLIDCLECLIGIQEEKWAKEHASRIRRVLAKLRALNPTPGAGKEEG